MTASTLFVLLYIAGKCGIAFNPKRALPGAVGQSIARRYDSVVNADDTGHLQEQAELREQLRHLDQVEDVLDEARGDFEHELRRAGDALLRAGGRSREVEARIKALKANIALNRKDLEKTGKQRRVLEARLAAIQRQS